MQRFMFRTFKKSEKRITGISVQFVTGMIVLSGLMACDEIIEPDLNDKRITIIAPTNNLQTTGLSHTFLWEELTNAEGYRLQIASPSFTEVQQLLLNEELTETQFEFTLSPGKYQWRIQGFNNTSNSSYVTYNLTIDSTLDLTGSRVILNSPENETATNEQRPTFSWSRIDLADNYIFEIRTPDFQGSNAGTPVLLVSETYTLTDDLEEGQYEWSVKAQNSLSESDYGTPRQLIVDITEPAAPSLTSPAANATISDTTTTFRWTRPSDNGSALRDSLFIFEDQTLTILNRAVETSSDAFTDTIGPGTYYWLVKSFDLAGNQGADSEARSFTVNQ